MNSPALENGALRNRPIIIGGSHRSGTTLLRHLLNAHSAIFCPSEIKFHQDLLGTYPNDPHGFARLSATITALGLPQEVWLDEFGRAFVRCYEMAAARRGKRRWADKCPENALHIDHWARLLGDEMMWVLVVRHPFDILSSLIEAKMDRVIPQDIAGKAAQIDTYLRKGLAHCARRSDASHIVRYEALAADPELTLRALLAALGETFEPAMLEAVRSSRQEGLEDWKISKRDTISEESVGRWRRDLTPEIIDEARPWLGPLALDLGYDFS